LAALAFCIDDPALPEVAHQDWLQSPWDRFVLARLVAAKLVPGPAVMAGAQQPPLPVDESGRRQTA